jgi:lipopolysaccharide transport system ATP-binding protein
MYARLAFSVAAHLDPEILIIDEILSVGDAAFQRKCMKRFYEIRDRGCTILLVAHDEYMIRSVCQKALYLRAGRMVAFGDPVDVVGRYVEDTMTPVDQASTAGAQTGVSAGTDIVPIGVAAGGVYAVPPEAVLAQVAVVESAPSGDLTAASVDTTHSDSGVAAAEPSPAEKGVSTAADVPDKVYRITHVVLLDEAGHPVDLVKHGSTMHLEFTFEALTSDIPDKISFVFNLYAVTGEYICGTTTLMEGMAAHPGARAGRVRITFPNVRLLTGKYHWRVAINDGVGLQWFQNAVHVCPFRIIVDRYASAGLVHLDREWSIELHR